MGKKLLVSMMPILGSASFARGTLSIRIDGMTPPKLLYRVPCSGIFFEIHSADVSPWVGFILVEDYYGGYTGDWMDGFTKPAAGSMADIQPYQRPRLGTGFQMITAGLGVEPGIQHEVIYHPVRGMSCISLWDESLGFDAPVDFLHIYTGAGPVVPFWADAEGPYEVEPDEEILLTGYHSVGATEWLWSIDDQHIGQGAVLCITYDVLVSDIGLDPGIHDVKLQVSNGEYVDSDHTTINIIPEPGTILLLTLGALFLRRNRHPLCKG
jgi:hypothetical protein